MYMILDASNLMFVNDITEPVLFDLVWFEQDCRGYYFPLLSQSKAWPHWNPADKGGFLVHTQESVLVKCANEREAQDLLRAYHELPADKYYSALECAKMRQFRREPA